MLITHQQFMDDIMLFGNVSCREVKRVKDTLDLFMEASGTQINKEKSCAYFFNTTGNLKSYLAECLDLGKENYPPSI